MHNKKLELKSKNMYLLQAEKYMAKIVQTLLLCHLII